jgi:formyltetrahydrofolate deformylase
MLENAAKLPCFQSLAAKSKRNGTEPVNDTSYILRIACDDQPGIVATVTSALATRGANIVESNQFWDRHTNKFFLRIAIRTPADIDKESIALSLNPAVDRFDLKLKIDEVARRPKIIIMVSRFDHAMLHLLYQIKVGWLDAEVVAIVSNHEGAGKVAEQEGIPFHYWPVTKENKAEQEGKLADQADQSRTGCPCTLHAGSDQRIFQPVLWYDHQHSPLLPAKLQGGQALSSGL